MRKVNLDCQVVKSGIKHDVKLFFISFLEIQQSVQVLSQQLSKVKFFERLFFICTQQTLCMYKFWGLLPTDASVLKYQDGGNFCKAPQDPAFFSYTSMSFLVKVFSGIRLVSSESACICMFKERCTLAHTCGMSFGMVDPLSSDRSRCATPFSTLEPSFILFAMHHRFLH